MKPFCKIKIGLRGISLRADPETFAAVYGLCVTGHGVSRLLAPGIRDDARLRVVNALAAFKSEAEAFSKSFNQSQSKTKTQTL